MSAWPIAVTMGDPCGIGPEIVARAFDAGAARDAFVVGDVDVMRDALRLVGAASRWTVRRVDAVPDLDTLDDDVLAVRVPPGLPSRLATLPRGRVDAAAGAAAAACVRDGARLALAGAVRALVTAPLHKAALAAAGEPWPGHTELLQAMAEQALGQAVPVRMMLANRELKVVLVTIHVALRRAIELLDVDGIVRTLAITHAAARRWGVEAPRIAVAGLNPHAGEDGLFGDEELRIIAPAIAQARRDGIDARGPFPPDTIFMQARDTAQHPGAFDVVVAMTHDHGLIPVKYLGVDEGVNVTLGLPFVRTSPDHGTAFDLAGTGRASAASLIAALEMARRLAPPSPPSA